MITCMLEAFHLFYILHPYTNLRSHTVYQRFSKAFSFSILCPHFTPLCCWWLLTCWQIRWDDVCELQYLGLLVCWHIALLFVIYRKPCSGEFSLSLKVKTQTLELFHSICWLSAVCLVFVLKMQVMHSTTGEQSVCMHLYVAVYINVVPPAVARAALVWQITWLAWSQFDPQLSDMSLGLSLAPSVRGEATVQKMPLQRSSKTYFQSM